MKYLAGSSKLIHSESRVIRYAWSSTEEEAVLKLIIGAVFVVAVGVVGSGVANAAPVDVNCAPCAPGSDTPVWDATFANGPWEPFVDSSDGVPGDGKGSWEKNVVAANGGAWEKAFPPAP